MRYDSLYVPYKTIQPHDYNVLSSIWPCKDIYLTDSADVSAIVMQSQYEIIKVYNPLNPDEYEAAMKNKDIFQYNANGCWLYSIFSRSPDCIYLPKVYDVCVYGLRPQKTKTRRCPKPEIYFPMARMERLLTVYNMLEANTTARCKDNNAIYMLDSSVAGCLLRRSKRTSKNILYTIDTATEIYDAMHSMSWPGFKDLYKFYSSFMCGKYNKDDIFEDDMGLDNILWRPVNVRSDTYNGNRKSIVDVVPVLCDPVVYG